jgi:uncharacterized protein (TIGR02145 family)
LVGTGGSSTAYQGKSVSLSADGNTAIVGGYGDNSAWVFTRSGSAWTQQSNKLVGSGNTGGAQQGISVSLSADGNTAIVGGWTDNSSQGATWVYTRSGSTWTQQGSKLVGTGGSSPSYQGYSVSLSADGNTAIEGGYYDNSGQGAAWVFTPSTCTAPAISSQSTATQMQCLNGNFTAITVTATGTELTYQWYSNTTASATGGTSLVATNGAQTNSYTPQAGTAGTLYYYCIVTGTCGSASSTVSGAFIVNAPSFTATVRHVSDLTATGSNIKWYADASGGTALLSTDVLPNGTSNYYASQTVNSVESTARFHVVATVDPTPCTPTGLAAQSYSAGLTVASLQATGGTGSTIRWYAAASNGAALATSTALVSGNHYYATQTINCTESATRLDVTVSANEQPTDGDGNVYNTVTIGTQVWMIENLKTTKYNDGTAITNVTGDASWSVLATGAYCDYDNNSANSVSYGRLYNWYAVNSNKLCPAGWHVPSDTEWTTLTTYLEGVTVAGGKLKETGTSHWTDPNTGATNSSGFTALPGGCRSNSSLFQYRGLYGFWWSSTANDGTYSWTRSVFNTGATVSRGVDNKPYGFSVRCLKDSSQ